MNLPPDKKNHSEASLYLLVLTKQKKMSAKHICANLDI